LHSFNCTPTHGGFVSCGCSNPLGLIAALNCRATDDGPLLYDDTVIGTRAVDGWAVTFGTARRKLGGAVARPGPSSLYQM